MAAAEAAAVAQLRAIPGGPWAKGAAVDPLAISLAPGLAPAGHALPRRSWIGGAGWLIPSALNVCSGAPGSLKSTLMGHIAVALACGEMWAGLEPARAHRVLIAHWEDDTDEMWRRLHAAAGIIAPGAHGLIARNLALIHMADHGPLIQQADIMQPRAMPGFAVLKAAIAQHDPEVVILDPLAEAVAVQENDNAMQRLALAPLRRLAQERKAAVVVIHHDRKGSEGSALDRMRGGSALGGLIRRHLPVRQMTVEQARQFQIPEEDADGFICLERGKTQYARQRGPAWFRVASLTLPNGDDAAALEPWSPPSLTVGPEHLVAALAAVRRGHDGYPLTKSNKSPACYVRAFEAVNIPRGIVAEVLWRLMADGEVAERTWRDPTKRMNRVRLWADGNDLSGWVL